MIVIVTECRDPHADRVEDVLNRHGARYVRFDNASFPTMRQFANELSPHGRRSPSFSGAGSTLDLSEVRALWWRRPDRTVPGSDITDPLISNYVREECDAFLKDVWQSLECSWIPGPEWQLRSAERKMSQLQVAARLGFNIPRTLVTNDPEAFISFYRQFGPRLISKLPSNALMRTSVDTGIELFRFTEALSPSDLGYIDTIRYAPVIFQERVEKKLEFRVTVVGQRIFAVAIDSQRARRTEVDWRHYDTLHVTHETYQLPRDVERKCLELLRHFGLAYGAIDLILTPGGEYVFLEMNPNGQYLWLEDLVKVPISEAIAELLIQYDNESERQS